MNLLQKFSQIYEGWRNNVLPPHHLKEIIHENASARQQICMHCEYNSTKGSIGVFSRCLDCGCQLLAKTACLSCECPLKEPKWTALITPEEDREVENKLKDE